MALDYATMQTRILQLVQDTGGVIYKTAELGYLIEDGLKRISEYDPFIVEVVYQVESRTGTETAGTTSTLTDTTESQFLSTDDDNEKVVHNLTDDTWAVVTGYTSTSILTISKDIMDIGDEYELYNKRCKNKRQIYIGDMPTYLWIDSVEYPIGTERNFIKISRDVIELDVEDGTIQDSDSTLDTLEQVEVLIRFALPQILSQLTVWAGALTANALIGATTIAINGMGSAETIEVGEVFNLESHRTNYIVTTAVTMSSGAGNLVFYPPLEAAASNTDVITFIKSTLQPQHERILRDLVAGEVMTSKSSQPLQEIINAIAVLTTASTAIGEMSNRINQAVKDDASGRTETDKGSTLVTANAAGAIAKVDAEISQALADLDTGRALINTINKGGAGVAGNYAQYAGGDVTNARGYLEEAISYMRQAQADEGLSGTYGTLSARELNNASQYLNQAVGYLRKINTAISLAGASRYMEERGERKIAHAERELQQLANPRVARVLSRW